MQPTTSNAACTAENRGNSRSSETVDVDRAPPIQPLETSSRDALARIERRLVGVEYEIEIIKMAIRGRADFGEADEFDHVLAELWKHVHDCRDLAGTALSEAEYVPPSKGVDRSSYVDDVRNAAFRMAGVFALVDGDLEEGDVGGSTGDRRRDFNVALSRLCGALEAIESGDRGGAFAETST